MSNNINMPVRPCEDGNGNQYSPVVYEESMFNNDGTRMHPVPSRMIAKAYDPTQTYPTYSPYCINDNKYYKFTGSGTTTGAFDDTKWTETDAAEEFTTLNSTLTVHYHEYNGITIASGAIGKIEDATYAGKILIGFKVLGVASYNVSVTQAYIDGRTGVNIAIKNNGNSSITTGVIAIYYMG